MKSNISHIQETKIRRKFETDKNLDLILGNKHNTTVKKPLNIEKGIPQSDDIKKTKTKKIENNLCLTHNLKYNHNSKKITKTKIKSKNSFKKGKNETINLSKNKTVKKMFSPNKVDISSHTVTAKKYSHKNHNNVKVENELLNIPQCSKINFNEKIQKYIPDYLTETKAHKNNILSSKNIHKSLKKENIIDISDSEEDSILINNDEESEKNNLVINTSFPKLSSNPFLVLKDEKKENFENNNQNNLFFSPSLIRKKGRCIQQSQLYYNNKIKSPSKTKTVLSINSSTTQNSNDTINNINAYNLDTSKRKKLNDLNSNINIDGEIDNDKDKIINNQNSNIDENNYILLFKNLLISVKNGDERKFVEIVGKIKDLQKNVINFNFQDAQNRNTVLHYACQVKNDKIIKYLLELNCDPNIKNNNMQTPLHVAAKKGYVEICKLLIENGALLNIYDSYKKTPIHYACENNYSELIQYFYESFIETDTNEKICDNLTNNKEINSLFHDYLKSKTNNLVPDKQNCSIDFNKELTINNHHRMNHFISGIFHSLNNKNQENLNNLSNNLKNKSTDKIIKSNISRKKIINQKQKKENTTKNNKTNSYSNLSLNKITTIPNGQSENNKLIITNLEKFNSKSKKIANNNKNKLLFQENNHLSKKSLNNPFIKDNYKKKDSISKNKEKDLYFQVNKTYDEKSKTNEKTIKFQPMIPPKTIKNNCLNINKQKDKEKEKEENLNTTYDKTKQKKNTSSTNIKFLIKKQQIECFTEQKNNKENIAINKIKPNHITEKKKSKEYFEIASPTQKDNNNIISKISSLNQTMDTNINMNITSINAYNKMSLSLNLIQEEEEKINTKHFICLALLGKGSFGEVYLVQKISNKKNYAMKILRKERIMGQNLSRYALAERNVLSLSNHPFIVKLNYAFQTLTKLFLILEYCPGGDLSKHLILEKKFDEKRAKFYLCEILLALEDLHKRNIIFRDLKPENVVLDEEGHCKLTDFGLSKEGIDNDQYTKSFCGSIAYLAPEVLQKKGHGKAVDWYLLGVLLYEMLTGVTPYYDKNKNNLFYNIQQGKLLIPDFVSENAKSLLKGLLKRDPKKRLGGGSRDAEEIKEHKFFEDVNWKNVYEKKIKPPKAMKINSNMYIFNKPKFFADENNLEEIFGNNSLQGWTFINKIDM